MIFKYCKIIFIFRYKNHNFSCEKKINLWYHKFICLISENLLFNIRKCFFFSKVKKWTFPKHKHVLFSNAHHFQIPGTYAIFKHIFDPFYIKKKWFSDLKILISDSYFWFFYMKKQNFCYEKIPFKDL